jgi:hypothetical protein
MYFPVEELYDIDRRSKWEGLMAESSSRTQITVAIIGVAGVIGAALIANGAGLFGSGSSSAGGTQASTTCRFTTGPRAGTTQYYPPGTPGLIPAFVGGPCHDGAGSAGYAIADSKR